MRGPYPSSGRPATAARRRSLCGTAFPDAMGEAEIEAVTRNIETAARVAFAGIARADAEITPAGTWNPSRYDADSLTWS